MLSECDWRCFLSYFRNTVGNFNNFHLWINFVFEFDENERKKAINYSDTRINQPKFIFVCVYARAPRWFGKHHSQYIWLFCLIGLEYLFPFRVCARAARLFNLSNSQERVLILLCAPAADDRYYPIISMRMTSAQTMVCSDRPVWLMVLN